jgi:Predicted membrane protein (DUF2254)
MAAAVGDTLVEGRAPPSVRGARKPLLEDALLHTVQFARERTFEQDPKYPIRFLVDVAIRAPIAGHRRPDHGSTGDRLTRGPAMSRRQFLLITTCVPRKLGFNELNGLVSRQDGRESLFLLDLTMPCLVW